jgi:hypothetical protein
MGWNATPFLKGPEDQQLDHHRVDHHSDRTSVVALLVRARNDVFNHQPSF